MSIALPVRIGVPATRALAHTDIASLDDLVTRNASDAAAIHGMGPQVLRILHEHAAAMGSTWSGDEGALAVDAYLANIGPAQRDALSSVRNALRTALPHADECIKYAMPAFALDGAASRATPPSRSIGATSP